MKLAQLYLETPRPYPGRGALHGALDGKHAWLWFEHGVLSVQYANGPIVCFLPGHKDWWVVDAGAQVVAVAPVVVVAEEPATSAPISVPSEEASRAQPMDDLWKRKKRR